MLPTIVFFFALAILFLFVINLIPVAVDKANRVAKVSHVKDVIIMALLDSAFWSWLYYLSH